MEIGEDVFYGCAENLVLRGYADSTAEAYAAKNSIAFEEISDAVVAKGTCGANGDNLSWTLDDKGMLTISGKGEMADYSVAYNRDAGHVMTTAPWGDKVKRVVLEDGVTSIGNDAFCDFYDLTSAKLPNGLKRIGAAAFRGCGELMNVTIPDSVTRIEVNAFADCYKALTSVSIPAEMKCIEEGTFMRCESLRSITIPEGIEEIGFTALIACSGLKQLYLPASVTNINEMDSYFGWESMESINVDSANPVYTSVDGVLFDKSMKMLIVYPAKKDATSYEIPEGVERICYGAFYASRNLSNITISNTVKRIGGNTFDDCDKLTSIDFPENVESVGYEAFLECYGLTNAIIRNRNADVGEHAFDKSVTISCYKDSSADTWAQKNGNPIVYLDDQERRVLILPANLKTIEAEAFAGSICETVIVPEGCESIGARAFANCKNLTYIRIPTSVKTIAEDAFEGCGEVEIDRG